MNNELPAESIAAIATVIAATISAAFSFVNLTLTKEQKTSDLGRYGLMVFDKI